jgi:hypothetical protein
MTTINNLPLLPTLRTSDQFVVWAPNQGDSRRVPYNAIKTDILDSFNSDIAATVMTFSNKTFNLVDNNLTGTFGQFNAACSDADFVSVAGLAASGASAGVGFLQAGTGAVGRTVQAKLREYISAADFGAVGDGVTDDTAAITLADANVNRKFVPRGTYDTTLAATDLDGPYWGAGQIRDVANNLRGPWFSAIKAAPSSFGDFASVDTAFNGDLSKNQIAMEHRITGAATLGQPATGYLYRPEAMPIYGYLYNASGWNNSTSGNDGRTGVAFSRVQVFQSGQGDAVCYNASAFVTGAKAGATDFLANPAAVLFNGDIEGGQDGVYLNAGEFALRDGGFDVAGIGFVYNLYRTNNTGALGVWWAGVRVQSQGTVPVDQVIGVAGDFANGIDFAMGNVDFGANQAAISLKGNQRIYLNNFSTNDRFTDGYNGDWIDYDTGSSSIRFVQGGSSRLLIAADRITMLNPPVLPTVTVAGLPTAAGKTGAEIYVSDATATTPRSIVAGGGANFVKVFSNGTNWLIAV